MATIWITGGKGFIGRHLARYLAGQGDRVFGLGHGAWPPMEAAHWGFAGWVNGEISSSNLGQLSQLHGAPDAIFHLAGGSSVGTAMANPQEDFHRTVVSSAELLEWVRLHSPATRVIAVSSAAVYGAGHADPISEDAITTPFSAYGAHKLMMETLCRSYAANFGLQVVIPRLFSVYGAEIRKQLLWDLCCKFAAGGKVELGGTGEELRDWTDVRDVARALGLVARLASQQAHSLNIATGVATPIRDIAAIVAARWSEDGSSSFTFSGRSRPGDPVNLVADVSRLRALDIACPIVPAQGVAEYVDWFKSLQLG